MQYAQNYAGAMQDQAPNQPVRGDALSTAIDRAHRFADQLAEQAAELASLADRLDGPVPPTPTTASGSTINEIKSTPCIVGSLGHLTQRLDSLISAYRTQINRIESALG